jgi:hypothetical protein
MADTLEEILNQSYTVDSFTNNSLTLLSTDSSTRYVIKDIYVNTDNVATLQNLKLYSNGFLLGNFLYGGSGSEIIGTSGNLTLQSDGLTDYYASAYDLRFSILHDTTLDYYDIAIPYIGNTLISSSIPSASSSLILPGEGGGQTLLNTAMVYPDFTSGSTAYYFWSFQNAGGSIGSAIIRFYQDVTNTNPDYNNSSLQYKPWTPVPTIPQYVYTSDYPDSYTGLNYWTFNSTAGGAYVKGDVTIPVNTSLSETTLGWQSGHPRMYPITDSTGNWNGGGLYKFGGITSSNYSQNYLIRFLTPTSLRSFHRTQDVTNDDFIYFNGTSSQTLQHSGSSFTGEFDTDFEAGETPYFILIQNTYGSDDTLRVLKVFFNETAEGNQIDTIPDNVIEGTTENIELIKTIFLTGNDRLKNSYVHKFLYKNELYYISTDNSLKSINWKTEKNTTIASGFTVSGQSMAVPQLQIPSQSTMNSRGYNTRTSFDLRITGIKSL